MNFYQATLLNEDLNKPTPQNRYAEGLDEIIMIIRENLPFFAKEMRDEVSSFQTLCTHHRACENILQNRDLTPEEMGRHAESHKRIKDQLDKVENAIRNRLSKFD